MKIDLSDKVVLVTGASKGIGRAIAAAVAEAGAAVALHYNRSEKDVKELQREIGRNNSFPVKTDLENPMNAGKLFKDVVENFGRVDVLVNNAGIFESSPVKRELEDWYREWQRTVAVNLTSAGMLCHEAINHFIDIGGGRIINISSRAAFRGETEDYLGYAASKGGMISLNRSIARSFGKYNIKSFAIAPGFVRTEMMKYYLGGEDEKSIGDENSLPEITEPKDIAPLIVLIATGMMDHATGTTIDMNAGSYMR